MSLTDQERHVIAHSLGDPKPGVKPYRNHFCASEGHDDWQTLQALCARGLMVSRNPSALSGGDVIFIVTDAGVAELRAVTPAEHEPRCPWCARPLARVAGPGEHRGWACVSCNAAGDPDDDHPDPADSRPCGCEETEALKARLAEVQQIVEQTQAHLARFDTTEPVDPRGLMYASAVGYRRIAALFGSHNPHDAAPAAESRRLEIAQAVDLGNRLNAAMKESDEWGTWADMLLSLEEQGLAVAVAAPAPATRAELLKRIRDFLYAYHEEGGDDVVNEAVDNLTLVAARG